MSRPVRLTAAALAAVVLLASCKVDVHLGVRVSENGSGVVQARFVLDRDALDAIGGDLGERLRVADLVQAGWAVDVNETDAGAEAVAEKRFRTPEELTAIVDQLSGDVGPFRDFVLRRHRSTFETDFSFEGRVDLDAGVGASSLDPEDEGVVAELEDEGIQVEQLREFLRERVDQSFDVEVVVDLPGDGSHNAPREVGGEPRWTPRPGEVLELKAASSERHLDRLVLVSLGSVLGLGAAGVLAAWAVRRRRVPVTPSP